MKKGYTPMRTSHTRARTSAKTHREPTPEAELDRHLDVPDADTSQVARSRNLANPAETRYLGPDQGTGNPQDTGNPDRSRDQRYPSPYATEEQGDQRNESRSRAASRSRNQNRPDQDVELGQRLEIPDAEEEFIPSHQQMVLKHPDGTFDIIVRDSPTGDFLFSSNRHCDTESEAVRLIRMYDLAVANRTVATYQA